MLYINADEVDSVDFTKWMRQVQIQSVTHVDWHKTFVKFD